MAIKILKQKRVVLLGVIVLLYTLVVTPLLIINVQKRQTARSNAASSTPTPTPPVCGTATSSTMLVIDRSGSMGEKDGSSGTKISNAKTAAANFVDIIAQHANNEAGLVSFATSATLNSPLSNNFSGTKTQINSLNASGDTCIQCAIDQTNKAIASGQRSGIKNVAVLLTDGIANYIEGTNKQVSASVAEQAALTAAKDGHTANGTIFFTIGLGSDVNAGFLKQLAAETGGQYFFPPTTDVLNAIYNQISQIIAQGSVSGYVFNDANGNGAFDTNEQKLSGWTVQLTSQGSSAPQSITTDSTGSFMIPDLCNGTYTLKELTQPGWGQTVPANADGYTFTISDGNAFTDKIFGNKVVPTPEPTNTPTPTTPLTQISLTVLLDGIGSRGDNANPTASSLSNKNPQHTVVPASLQLFNSQNQLLAQGTGNITYNSTAGDFTGSVFAGDFVNSGNYTLKIKTDKYLRKLVPGIQVITAGENNILPSVALVAGDSNNDNALNILDYNILLDCYSDLTVAVDCSNTAKKVSADFNDDGLVNQVDYNLFIREISTQPGE